MNHPGLMVVDWSNMCHRAFHGMGGTDDLLANDIFDLANHLALSAAQAIMRSGAIVVNVMDGGLSGRDLLYAEYKANRTNREDRPQGLTGAIGEMYKVRPSIISHLQVEGFEADDVMANLAWEYARQNPGSPSIILSNDKDLFQVVNSGVSILRHKGSGEGMLGMELITPEIVQERFGFEPLKIIDYKALQGDIADNIPRIPGIGHGIACKLVQRWGGALPAVQAALDDEQERGFTPRIKQILIEHYQTIKLNMNLIRLKKVPTAKTILNSLMDLQSPIP